jgi:hypothetical protein
MMLMHCRHCSTRGNVLITDLAARARSGAAVREAGGAATHASLAGTLSHHSPMTACASYSNITPHETPQEDGARLVQANPNQSRTLPLRVPLNKPPNGLGDSRLAQRTQAPRTPHKACPQRGLVWPHRPHNPRASARA